MMSEVELPLKAIRSQVASAINIIIQTSRFNDGSRKLTHIVECLGLDEIGEYRIYPLFEFKHRGYEPGTGKVLGQMEALGNIPTFADDIKTRGLDYDENWFKPPRH
jgi:pilus assembly protein CpaF